MEREQMKYPVGDQSFESIRLGNFVYVDKSMYIEKLLGNSKYIFLGRPRRFGKSLFLSMMKCFFEGKRELFKGLYADSMDWDWEPVPVLYLDLNIQKYKGEENELDLVIEDFLDNLEVAYGIVPGQKNHSIRFSHIIREINRITGKNVVILVDEYDKPLVNNIHNRERFETYHDQLAAFYSNFKSSADYIRMVLLTGVTRFGKLSVFSGLNNIRDISFNKDFDAICGITHRELVECLSPGIEEMADAEETTFNHSLDKLKQQYDGYHFCADGVDIYNPYSILNALADKKYANYWIASGTPTLLMEQLKRTNTDIEKLASCRCAQTELEGLDATDIRPKALFYQTGYLTIKDYNPRRKIFTLGFPNDEVREGFFEYILPYYCRLGDDSPQVLVSDLLDYLESGEIDAFMKRLTAFFAGISYEMALDDEKNVQNALFILFRLIGIQAQVEYRTSDGRIDILIQTADFIYIMELKYDAPAEVALEQIHLKEYALPWSTDHRTVIAVGLSYSSQKRRLTSWVAETLR